MLLYIQLHGLLFTFWFLSINIYFVAVPFFFLVVTLNIFVNKIVVLYVLCVIVKKLLSLRWELRTWILGEKKTDSENLFYSQLETEHPGNWISSEN